MLKKIDTLLVGIITGVLLPAILYFILIHPRMKTYALLNGYYYELLLKSLPLLLTRCIFPNAVLFFLLIWQNLNLAAKGILISTAILTGMLVIMNFFL